MQNSDLINILIKNDKEEIRKFVLENGKEGKPFCPISFEEDKDEEKEEK